MARQRDIIRRERPATRRKRLRGADERAKSAFLSIVSHELRTPLNTILGQAERLTDEALPVQVREAAAAIRDSGEGLYALLNDILEMARLEGGAAPAEAAALDIRALVEGVRRMCQPQAWARDLDLEVDIDPAVPARLRGDAGRIRQTLVNLTGNALKFTERGGVRIRVEMEGGALKLSVSDTGIGIDRKDCARLFRAFEQNEDVLTRQHGGLGLGLALCRRLVASMGGRIGLESEKGTGSMFWFTARTASTEAACDNAGPNPLQTSDSLAVQRVRGLRVLAADDNPLHRQILARIFEDAAIAFEIVDNGLQAAEAAGKQAFDAILLDARMPMVDGIQAARMIRTLQQRHKGAAIFIACAEADVAESDAGAVCDGILRKPYTAHGVVAVLAGVAGDGEDRSFDAAGVLELEKTVGRAALLDVLHSFLASAAEMTARIDAALPEQDSATVEQAARDLAGAASGLGLNALTAAARDLSQAARRAEGRLGARASAVAALSTEAHQALAALYPDLAAQGTG
jgi:CheY-like chemotaxis protein